MTGDEFSPSRRPAHRGEGAHAEAGSEIVVPANAIQGGSRQVHIVIFGGFDSCIEELTSAFLFFVMPAMT